MSLVVNGSLSAYDRGASHFAVVVKEMAPAEIINIMIDVTNVGIDLSHFYVVLKNIESVEMRSFFGSTFNPGTGVPCACGPRNNFNIKPSNFDVSYNPTGYVAGVEAPLSPILVQAQSDSGSRHYIKDDVFSLSEGRNPLGIAGPIVQSLEIEHTGLQSGILQVEINAWSRGKTFD